MNPSKIQDVVDWLRTDYNLSAPVNVEWLAKTIGIEIKKDDLEESSLSGFAVQKHGKKYIGVNCMDSHVRQRFTIAHELGHLFLHDDTVNYDQGGVMLFRDDKSSDGSDAKEVEANRFAAELLMPADDLREDISNEGSFDLMNKDPHENAIIKKLAEKYDVSEQAMSVRLTTLYFS
jgi:Zn-dependent peptidase ImmA (M78 family)